jgi:diacylglycerol kinase family enzyme
VVAASETLRRGRMMNNSLSYICGVATTLVKKQTFTTEVHFGGVVDANGNAREDEVIAGDFLLCAMGNLPFYGGGFKAVPAAAPTDGKMDVILVRDISRARFVSLVGDYRKGTHINPETLTAYPKFAPYIEYRRCDRVTFSGVRAVCLDGEITPATGVRAEIVPAAVRYVPVLKK